MDCNEFLEDYSAYLDGLLSSTEREQFQLHADSCEACARYDRVIQRGLEIFRDLPRIDPSPDFVPRLKHRIYHIDDGIPLFSGRHGGSAALVAVAAVGLLAFAWLPFATQMPVEVELPAVSAEAPPEATVEAMPSLFDRGPFVAPDAPSWQAPPAWERTSAWHGNAGWNAGPSDPGFFSGSPFDGGSAAGPFHDEGSVMTTSDGSGDLVR